MTKEERLETIDQNLQLYRELLEQRHENKFCGWSVVALFYAALHQVEIAITVLRGQSFAGHKERNDYIRQNDRLREINQNYRFLYDYSRRVRYDGQRPTPTEARDMMRRFIDIEAVANQISGQ